MIRNPILPGFHPDPSILRVEGDYYIAVSTFEWFPGIAIYHSKNLKEWTLRTHALTDEADLDLRRLPSAKGVWAPCLTRDAATGLFHLAYSLMLSHNARYFDVDNFLVVSPSIDGPWSRPAYLHSVGFDPSLFHDDDGRKYVACLEWELAGMGRPGGIVIQEYDPIEKKMVGPLRRVWAGGTRRGCVEGPHLYKRNGWYYLVCAEGGTGYGHCVTVARSRSVWGPYEGDPENPILSAADDFDEADRDDFLKSHRYEPSSPLQKTGHASWVETASGEHYLAHLCARPFVPELRCTLGRETALQKAFWTADGWLRVEGGKRPRLEIPEPALLPADSPATAATAVAVPAASAAAVPAASAAAASARPARDHFDGPWDPELVTPRVPLSRFGSVTEKPHHLRLRGMQSLCSLDTVALVARRLTSLHAEAAAAVDFDPDDFRQSAGLVAYYDNMDHLFLRVCRDEEDGDRLLVLTRLDNGKRNDIYCAVLPPAGRVRLRLTVRSRELRFFYTLDDAADRSIEAATWLQAGPVLDTSELSDEYCSFGEFTGTFVGIACVDSGRREKPADFDWFEYRPE